ncbi:hypothetical protein [Dactylosporangium sp. CA-092794]|uniref:hypothetical protein n=1 Tax=Dactylosporangium sp. CA-092794 TaxID=3239929 RepID=UPI003D8BD7B5
MNLVRSGLVAALAVLAVAAPPAGPAWAAGARVAFSPATLDPDYATTLQLQGSGFQAVKGGFGGVYVLFGTVSGSWQPSKGGTSGADFRYVQDEETKDNHGYQRFVSFEDGGTLYAANGGIVHPDGTWSTTLIVPGATFPARGRNGAVEQIDCRKVSCGIITIGAHGVVEPRNETFTPVTFAAPKQPAPPATTQAPAAAPPPAAASAEPSVPAAADPSPVATSGTSGTAGWWFAGAAALVLLGVAGALRLRRRTPPAGSTTP